MLKQKSKSPSSILRSLLLVTSLAVLAVGLVPYVTRQKTALAATNSTINFQARLFTAAGGVVPDGIYNVEFKIYDTVSAGATGQGSCSGNCKWVETRTGANKVAVRNGYLAAGLGGVKAFGSGINWDQELWLTMNIGGAGSPVWDGEMNPRLKLTSVPYAFRSGAVASADGSGVLTAANGESGTICVRNAVSCGFVQGVTTDFIQNSTSPQAATINIASGLSGSAAMTIQGAASASVPVVVIRGGATPGSAADLLQLRNSDNAVLFKVGNDGATNLARSLNIDYTSGATNQFTIQGPSNTFVTVNAANNKFYIGDPADCSGRFCVSQKVAGTAGASYNNTYNASIVNVTAASTIVNQDVVVADTSSGASNLLRGIRIDMSGTTNASATVNAFLIKIPSTATTTSFGGNAIQVENGPTNIFRITNTGQATFQSLNNTNTAFRIMNAAGIALFTLNTNGMDNGIYVAGSGAGGGGGRVFFGPTGDTGIWIGERGATDTNVLALNGNSGISLLANNTEVVSVSSAGAVTFKSSSDSATALQIQKASGASLFAVESSNNLIRIQGTGSNGAGGRLNFGDSSYVWIGEAGTGDTDTLALQGSAGIVMSTSGNANAIVVDSSGRVGLGTASPTEALQVVGNLRVVNSATSPARAFRVRTTGGGVDMESFGHMFFSTWSDAAMTGTQTAHVVMYTSGAMTFPSISTIGASIRNLCIDPSARTVQMSTNATSCSTSSLRYKENVHGMPEGMGLSAIMALRPVTYTYKTGSDKREKIGFIAEDMDTVLPDLVEHDEQGGPSSINYEYLTANLAKAIQQQQVQIDSLRTGLWSGGLVSKDTVFKSLVTFNGNVAFNGSATFEGNVDFRGSITYNRDAAGTVTIPKGQTTAAVTFSQPYAYVPHIAVSSAEFLDIKISDKTINGFTVEIQNALTKDLDIDWIASQITSAGR